MLKMWKRFDIASSRLHTIIDNNLPVVTALITVIHIKPQGATLHQPGFTLLATDGFLEKIDVTMERGGKGVEVVEEFDMHYKSISSPIRNDWARTTYRWRPSSHLTQRP